MPGNARPLKVKMLKSSHGAGVRRRRAGLDPPLVREDAEVAVDAAASARRGWMTRKPIIPIAICTVSSACGWYMYVPCWRSVNS